jgi:hypothetical protein
MKDKLSDQDVLNLLASLKKSEGNYPSDMIQSRRDMFLKQAATMAVLTVDGGGSADGQTTVSSAGGGFSTGTLLETALVVALVIEAGVVAYIYRDKIADFVNSTLSPNVEIVASPPGSSSPAIPSIEETFTETLVGTATITVTITETPAPAGTVLPAADNNFVDNNNDNSNNGGNAQITSTPNPNDNPGLHLGQTKQPTKDPNTDKKNDNNDSKDKDIKDTNDKGNKK